MEYYDIDMTENTLCKRLNSLWKSKLKLERLCKVMFDNYFDVPELMNSEKMSKDNVKMLRNRIRLFKTESAYNSIILTCECLGKDVKRSNDGMHSLMDSRPK